MYGSLHPLLVITDSALLLVGFGICGRLLVRSLNVTFYDYGLEFVDNRACIVVYF